MSKCWVLYSDDVTPLGIEHDHWIKDEALVAYDDWCKKFPFAEFILYEVENKDEANEKWHIFSRREGAWPEDINKE